jgi:hypothetical protein
MRKCASLMALLFLIIVNIGLGNNNADLIFFRRAYLTELGMPPSVAEIEWLLTYETTPYTTGIDYILTKKYGAEESNVKKTKRAFYLSSAQECIQGTSLTQSQQHYILRYQAGNLNATIEEAKRTLISCAITMGEIKEEPIDYLAICLWGKFTNTAEFNHLNKIYNTTVGSEFDKLYAVLTIMLLSNNFLYY